MVCTLALAAEVWAADTVAESPLESDTNALSEDLIYSVGRVPERPFDTARDCEVITRDEIEHSNARELGQLLEWRLGIGVVRGESGNMPIVRGLAGKQIMFLVDGVKVNNSTWRGASKEYLSIFDLSQIERIEIVRGVVSVLGTESLGGVVNIITKKGVTAAPGSARASVAVRYASAESSLGSTIAGSGSVGKLRFDAGISRTRAGDVEGGEGVGTQNGTRFEQQSGHLNGQWLLSPDKTIEFNYQLAEGLGETPGNGLALLAGEFDPSRLSLFRLSYQDLTSRGWEDSLRVTLYSNRQREIRNVLLRTPPANIQRTQSERDTDTLNGLNVELSAFAASHHVVYGLDFTDESIESAKQATVLSTGVTTFARGNELDGATYRTLGLYLQDRFDVGKWLTVIAGARLSQFEASGHENSNLGNNTIDSKHGNVTGALNLIGHLSPKVNLIGNVIRGYRAPNLDELGGSQTKPGFFWIPNTDAEPEKVLSYEAGLKYEGSRVRGHLFYFENRFTDHLVLTPTTFRGLPFNDANGNGRQDGGEGIVVHVDNVGKASIHGVEGKLAYHILGGLSVFASYSHVTGTDEVADGPLSLMPPASGTAGLRYLASSPKAPWFEVDYRLSQEQDRLSPTDVANIYIGPNGVPSYEVLDVRAGLTMWNRVALSVALENVFDEKYKFMASNRYEAGRQLVVGTKLLF
jgi:outer membrane receptor for ferrienterochelin and colicin